MTVATAHDRFFLLYPSVPANTSGSSVVMTEISPHPKACLQSQWVDSHPSTAIEMPF